MEMAGVGGGSDDAPEIAPVYTPTGTSKKDAFLLTMAIGLQRPKDTEGKTGPPALVRETVDPRLTDWLGWILQWDLHVTMVPLGSPKSIDDVLSVHSFFRAGVLRRNFFITEKGYFGLGPLGCTHGDKVAILLGGRVPYVLPPAGESSSKERVSDDRQAYFVRGDAYVHGMMQGELFKDAKSQTTVMRKIRLA